MISLVDFVKAFNSNLEYRILIVVDEICDVFSGNKEEFIKRVQNPYCFQDYYVQHVDLDVGHDYDYDNKNGLKMDTVYTLMLILLTTLMVLP